MKPYIIYCRVSTGGQEDGTSLDTQEKSCRALIEARGGVVGEVLREVMSGSLYLARTQLQCSIEMIENGERAGLVMLDLERFARHAAYQEIAYERITRAGGEILFVRDQFDNTPEGGMVRGIRGHVNQFYREKQRILSMEGSYARAASGIMPQRNKPPYAYRVTQQRDVDAGRASRAGIYVIIAAEAKWVRQIYKWRVAGSTLQQIADRLNARKVETMRGAPAWTPGVVQSILNNSVYHGEAGYGKTYVVVDERRLSEGKHHLLRRHRPREDWIIIPCPAVVTLELWAAAQTIKVL